MGWEERRGRLYFYRKERSGGTVRSVYMGRGRLAELADELVSIESLARSDVRKHRNEVRGFEADLATQCQELDLAVTALLEKAGYHRHNRGEWRKKRGA